MSALTLAGTIFIMTIGGISLGALLRRTLPASTTNVDRLRFRRTKAVGYILITPKVHGIAGQNLTIWQ